MRLFWRVHRLLYWASGGRIGARLFGWHVILLKTTGRKSGQARLVTLNALEDNDRYVVAASFAGQPRHPAWFLNLQQQPEVQILEYGKWIPFQAREAQDAECEQLWKAITEKDPSYAEYQSRTTRRIPVVIFQRKD
jgi:deazaflavin-dependent oxidoreductase (nitroreductase family)